jgi:hypothetical protein
MIHTVYIDDSTPKGKVILSALRKETGTVRFDNPVESPVVPDGYMTSTDFRIAVKQGLRDKLTADGRI